MEHHKEERKKSAKRCWLFIFSIAAAIGAAIGAMISNTNNGKFQKLKRRLSKSGENLKDDVSDAFGEFNENLKALYLEMRENIGDLAYEAKKKSYITKEKYDEIVEHAVEKFSRGRDWTKETVRNLIKSFKKDWDKFKDDEEEE